MFTARKAFWLLILCILRNCIKTTPPAACASAEMNNSQGLVLHSHVVLPKGEIKWFVAHKNLMSLIRCSPGQSWLTEAQGVMLGPNSFSTVGDARAAWGSQPREGSFPWAWKASFLTLEGKKDASCLFLNVKSSVAPFHKHSLSCIKFAFKLCVFVLPSLTGTYSSPAGRFTFGIWEEFHFHFIWLLSTYAIKT